MSRRTLLVLALVLGCESDQPTDGQVCEAACWDGHETCQAACVAADCSEGGCFTACGEGRRGCLWACPMDESGGTDQ